MSGSDRTDHAAPDSETMLRLCPRRNEAPSLSWLQQFMEATIRDSNTADITPTRQVHLTSANVPIQVHHGLSAPRRDLPSERPSFTELADRRDHSRYISRCRSRSAETRHRSERTQPVVLSTSSWSSGSSFRPAEHSHEILARGQGSLSAWSLVRSRSSSVIFWYNERTGENCVSAPV